MRITRPWLALACVALMGGAPTDEGSSPKDKPKGEAASSGSKPATVKVEKGPIKVEAELKGILEAERTVEVSLRPEAWAMPLTVENAVAHGTRVKKGDVVVQLELEKIDQAIKDLAVERALSDLTLEQAEKELPVLERFLPLDLAAAERSKKVADEDLKKFVEIERPQSERMAHFQVKSMGHWLEYAREELEQLQKMYRSKDLTEETEEMILKRQRHQVEQAEFMLRDAETRRDLTLGIDLPRQEQTYRETSAKQALALQKARLGLPLELSQKRLTLNKLQHESRKNAEKLAKLEKDRAAMTVRAPADGVVYYGKATHGQWTTAAAVAPRLQPGGVLNPSEVFLTIVTPRPAAIRATVEEKELHLLHPEMKGKAVPTGYPDLKLPARLVRIMPVPQAGGTFDARVEVELKDDADVFQPGMTCAVKFVSYRKDDALTVPSSAVFADAADEDSRYVYLPAKEKGAKPEKRPVKVGKTAGGKAEILDGLKEGDEILSSKP
jgi:HlyD family secretion protein